MISSRDEALLHARPPPITQKATKTRFRLSCSSVSQCSPYLPLSGTTLLTDPDPDAPPPQTPFAETKHTNTPAHTPDLKTDVVYSRHQPHPSQQCLRARLKPPVGKRAEAIRFYSHVQLQGCQAMQGDARRTKSEKKVKKQNKTRTG